MGDRCNWSLQKIGLPAELQHLEMGYSFAQPICNIRWPRRLQTLTFGMTFNRPLQDVLLPATLCELHFGNHFDQALDGIRWPSQVRLLHFGSDFNQSLATANLPDQLETLVLGRFFQQDLRTCGRAFAAIIVAPYPWPMLSVGTTSAVLAAVPRGIEHQAAVSQRSGRRHFAGDPAQAGL